MTIPDGLVPRWYRHTQIVSEGLFAGLCAGFAILVVFFAYDLWQGDAFRTPSALYAFARHGAAEARHLPTDVEYALRYTVIHLGIWLMAGVVAAYGIAISERGRGYGLAMSAVVIFCLLVATATIFEVPGLGIDTLWVGATIGGLVILTALTRRRLRSTAHRGRVS